MSNYIIINEDGELTTQKTISNTDKYVSDLGVITIINIQGPVPRVYIDKGNWEDIGEDK